MKLLPNDVRERIPPLYSGERLTKDQRMVVAKFFNPTGNWTWYVLEGQPEDDDYLFYGLVDGFEKEYGGFSLKELESVKGRFGLGIERDMYWTPISLATLEQRLGMA